MPVLTRFIFFLFDIVLLNVAMLLALTVESSVFHHELGYDIFYLFAYTNAAWIFLVLVSSPYNLTKVWSLSRILRNQISFLLVHLLITLCLVVFLNRQLGVGLLVIFYGVFSISFFLYRLIFYFIRKLYVDEPTERFFVIIGRNQLAYQTRKFYLSNPDMHYRFIGYIDFDSDFVSELDAIARTQEIHEIFCCVENLDQDATQALLKFGLDSLIKVKIIFPGNIEIGSWSLNDRLPGLKVSSVAIDELQNQALKRAFDLVFSSTLFILVLSWLIPIVSFLIKLDSKGPVFFIQQRNGEGNRPFGCIKFRTMVVNNEADSKQATKSDPRITRLGAFLRRSSIDELPQFINVLKGDMSVIGPRPHPIKLNEKFQPFITHIMSRHYVKPGITGLAQCMGYRGETQTVQDMENRVRLDRYYIENWSFWLDIKIIFLTVVSLIRGSDKAY